MKPLRRAILALAVLIATGSLQARPAHKKALADYFGPLLPRHLNDCRTCHLPETPGDNDKDKPHNPFGARLKEVKKELAKAGKETDIISRLKAIADEDSDGDGVPNLLELLAGHNPGEASDKPGEAGIARARKVLTVFQTRKVYPWKPFETVQRPALPQRKNAAWIYNPIDAFVGAEHELYDLKPRPDAPRHILVRRVHLDLVGVPPTRAELQAALGDPSADWYEKLVDKLLASPRYGERWGRHWMDVWRYVDYSNSGLQDGWTGVPNMWRWRDWIIASLNADKGYDRMVQEMLAADELCPSDLDAQPATCFLARNKGNNRDTWLYDSVNHSARAFLGVTMECARCHDHMYDPIKQDEYFRLRAVFEPYGVRTDPAKHETDTKKSGVTRVYDQNTNPKTWFYIRGVEQNPDKTKDILPGVPKLLGTDGFTVAPITLPREAYAPHRHPELIEHLRSDCRREIDAAKAGLKDKPESPAAELAEARLLAAESRLAALEAVLRVEELEDRELDKKEPKAWEEAALAADTAQRQAALLDARHKKLAAQAEVRQAEGTSTTEIDKSRRALAEAEKALVKAEQQAQQVPSPKYQRRGSASYGKTSSGRRLAFARWITSRANPLAARVAVNHMWLRHFGQAIVPSVFDFGAAGLPASHPALLDWLAAEFMDSGWSMKKLHRLMVLSHTYRLSATPEAVNLAADPDNQFLWRMPSRRMEAEVVRDSILHVSGALEGGMYGPELDPKRGLDLRRRSVYFKYTESEYLKVMEFFDAPPPDDCYKRAESIVPQQALTLLNSDLALTQARLLARDLAKEVGAEPAAFVKAAFEQVLSRPATAAEAETCVKFLVEQTGFLEANKANLSGVATQSTDGGKGAADPALRARENLVHLLLNHHDFVTIR
jgi:hypothetical protein